MAADPASEPVNSVVDAVAREFGLTDLVALGYDPITQIVILTTKAITIGELLVHAKRAQQLALAEYIRGFAELVDNLATTLNQGSDYAIAQVCTRLNAHARSLGGLLEGVVGPEEGNSLADLLKSGTIGNPRFYIDEFPQLAAAEKRGVFIGLAVAGGTFAALADVLRIPDLPKPRKRSADAAPSAADQGVLSRTWKNAGELIGQSSTKAKGLLSGPVANGAAALASATRELATQTVVKSHEHLRNWAPALAQMSERAVKRLEAMRGHTPEDNDRQRYEETLYRYILDNTKQPLQLTARPPSE